MTASKSTIAPLARIENRILLVRNQIVMIDANLAELYEVPTKALNQAINRNVYRFPQDFMFKLTAEEKTEVVTNCDHLAKSLVKRRLHWDCCLHLAS